MKIKRKTKKLKKCFLCNTTIIGRKSGNKKFCSYICSGLDKRKLSKLKFKQGELSIRAIKRILIEKHKGCQQCGYRKWRGKILSLEVDHKDGNPQNNKPKNVQLLCPNCHSITPNWKGKNIGSGNRQYRKKYYNYQRSLSSIVE